MHYSAHTHASLLPTAFRRSWELRISHYIINYLSGSAHWKVWPTTGTLSYVIATNIMPISNRTNLYGSQFYLPTNKCLHYFHKLCVGLLNFVGPCCRRVRLWDVLIYLGCSQMQRMSPDYWVAIIVVGQLCNVSDMIWLKNKKLSYRRWTARRAM